MSVDRPRLTATGQRRPARWTLTIAVHGNQAACSRHDDDADTCRDYAISIRDVFSAAGLSVP